MRHLKIILIIISVSFLIVSCGKKEKADATKSDDPFALADSLTFKALYDSSNSILLSQLEKFSADSNYGFYIDAVNRIAANYRKVANYDGAFAYVTKAIEISETRRDTVNLHIAQTYYLLGLMYKDYQISKDALLYLNKSLKIRETLLPENDPLIGDVYNNIGVIYYIKGDLEKAGKYFHEALKLRKQRGFFDKSVGSTYMNLGNIYSDLNDITKSLAYFDTALTIQKKVLGNNHPAVGSILHNIAGDYNSIGEIDSSLVYYKRALKIYKNVFGENHPLVANVYNNIGLYYKSVGDYENAINFFENSVKIKKKLGAAFKKELIDNYANIGMVYRLLKNYDLSIEAYKKALRIIEERENDFSVKKFANVARGLSLTYKSAGKNELALATIREAVRRAEESSGKDDFLPFRTKIFLSSVLNKTGGYGESIKNSKECVEFFKSKNDVIWLVFAYELLAEGYLMNEEFVQTLAALDSLEVLLSDGKSGKFDINKINSYSDVNAMLSETLGFAGKACSALFEKTENRKRKISRPLARYLFDNRKTVCRRIRKHFDRVVQNNGRGKN
ncbi:MAG: tetratricopeptide repeat protein [Chlorobi bacterium]|nr:tetratricopeptide repeat protein [Chlorobiota bacterium]